MQSPMQLDKAQSHTYIHTYCVLSAEIWIKRKAWAFWQARAVDPGDFLPTDGPASCLLNQSSWNLEINCLRAATSLRYDRNVSTAWSEWFVGCYCLSWTGLHSVKFQVYFCTSQETLSHEGRTSVPTNQIRETPALQISSLRGLSRMVYQLFLLARTKQVRKQ